MSEDKEVARKTPKEVLILFHHGWGTGIRNAFGLWGDNDALGASCGGGHPDEMSMLIITKAWERLQGRRSQAHGGDATAC